MSDSHLGKISWNKDIKYTDEQKQNLKNTFGHGSIPWNKELEGWGTEDHIQKMIFSLKTKGAWNKDKLCPDTSIRLLGTHHSEETRKNNLILILVYKQKKITLIGRVVLVQKIQK